MWRSLAAGLGKGVAAWLQSPNSANLAAAVTDETGSGALVFGTSPGFTTAANPATNDGATLGTSALQWSDLYLAEGGAINWDGGDATMTQVGNMVTLAGADLTVPNLTATTNITAGTAFLPDANDGATLGSSALQFSDLYLASGAVINFASGDYTVTHSTGLLTFSGNVVFSGATYTAYTPTVTASGGTFTTVSATGRYRKFGKMVHVRMRIICTTVGTASGRLLATLPSNGNGAVAGATGMNTATITGVIGMSGFDANDKITLVKASDGSFPITSGQDVYAGHVYEEA